MNKILCSTGTFVTRKNGRSHMLIPYAFQHLHCDGFEFMIYESWYDKLDKIVSDLLVSGVKICSVHAEKGIGEHISLGEFNLALRLFEINCRASAQLGVKTMVFHLWNGITSDTELDNNIALLPKLYDIAAQHGVILTIENVVAKKNDPMSNLSLIYREYPDVLFTFDTKMAAFHKQLDLLYSTEYSWLFEKDKIRHIHVSDYAGGYMQWECLRCLQLGKGTIDFDKFFAFLQKMNYKHDIVLESTASNNDGTININALNESLDKLHAYIS